MSLIAQILRQHGIEVTLESDTEVWCVNEYYDPKLGWVSEIKRFRYSDTLADLYRWLGY